MRNILIAAGLLGLAGHVKAAPSDAVTLTMTAIPPAGSLGPIQGRVDGLAVPQDHQLCIYLQSTASGENLYNGPKPFEDEGSNSPVYADGTFNYVTWWANDLYDPEAAFIYIVIVPTAYRGGMCDPILGTIVAPETLPLYENSVAWLKIPRVNNIAFALDTPLPLLASGTDITGTVTGIPEAAGTYRVLVYKREVGGGLTGPLPACDDEAGVVLTPGGQAGEGAFNVSGWAGVVGTAAYTANAAAVHLVVMLTPTVLAAGAGSASCVDNAGPSASDEGAALGLPPGVLGPRLASVEMTRAAVLPSATPTPTPSVTPSVSQMLAIDASAEPLPNMDLSTSTADANIEGSSGAGAVKAGQSVAVAVAVAAAAILGRCY